MGQPLAECDFNLATLHPAYPIKRRTSAERTQASPERRHPEEFAALDPLENNIRKERSLAGGSGGPLQVRLNLGQFRVRSALYLGTRDDRRCRSRR